VTLPVLSGWLPGRRVRRRGRAAEPEALAAAAPGEPAPWPDMAPRGGGVALVVRDLAVVPEPGAAVLARLDMRVAPGAVQGLVGPNGSGKSSALRTLADLLRTGRDPDSVRVEPPRGRAVLLPQQGGGWPGCTVAETLRLAARAGGGTDEDAANWVDALDLATVEQVLCDELSHGARRRVEMARVLLLRPALLLCDEPLAGLDVADREAVLDCLRAASSAGVTLVVAEHDRASLSRIATATTELHRLDLETPEVAPA
jgi:ABC-type multidrug transport system ATPase subunit